MKNADSVIHQLRRELSFLEHGGYRVESCWRVPRYFEDSPICTKLDGNCNPSCALLNFVPPASRSEAIPCRHIRLNDAGETLNSLYVTGTTEEIEAAVRSWLLSSIGECEGVWCGESA